MECNRDCFNCEYPDCIQDRITVEEYEASKDRDGRKHSSESDKERAKRNYYKNHERNLEKNRKYYHSHKDKFAEYCRVRREIKPVDPKKQHEYYLRWKKKKEELNGKKTPQ